MAMCISLPYQLGICGVNESTEQKNPEKKNIHTHTQGKTLHGWDAVRITYHAQSDHL
jgi:hypothetical protein